MPVAAKRKPAADSAAAEAACAKTGPDLTADITVGEGLQTLLAAALRTIRMAGARGDGARAQSIHRFRVAVRRLRSLLVAFSAVLPDDERRALGKRLAVFARRYGPVREWDVLIASTLMPLAAAFPDDPVVAEVAADAADARRRALPANAALGAEAADIAAALDAANFLREPTPAHDALWHQPLGDFVADLLSKRHRRLRRQLKHIDLADQHAFHQVRINVKKLRYPIELFRSIYEEKGVSTYLETIIRVQNRLGRLNDVVVARKLLAELPVSARSKALIEGWLARDALAARDQFPAAARAFRRASAFWKD
jgi:triphosphatase